MPGVVASLGEARALKAADSSYAAVLLLGPLYHLVRRSERIQALREARRVVRPGGVVAAAAISRFASFHDGFAQGFITDPRFVAMPRGDLTDGQHHNDENVPAWFTTAYFHHLHEFDVEVREAGLDLERIAGLEGAA